MIDGVSTCELCSAKRDNIPVCKCIYYTNSKNIDINIRSHDICLSRQLPYLNKRTYVCLTLFNAEGSQKQVEYYVEDIMLPLYDGTLS